MAQGNYIWRVVVKTIVQKKYTYDPVTNFLTYHQLTLSLITFYQTQFHHLPIVQHNDNGLCHSF